jgi:shikimate kinase
MNARARIPDIILVGPKHSGKTSAGAALAARCSGRFIDLDELVEQRSGKSPRTLYAEGPEVFREAEAGALASLLEAESGGRRVIAAGGGVIDNPAALALIAAGKTLLPVYLNVSAETAWERIRGAGELPPFLKTEHPMETHRALHRRRAAAYRKLARFTIEAEGKSPRQIALEIHALLPQSN